jgi:excisionase family DNA binding protein
MAVLLTTKDLQELINVDKSTIYRMAEDGRLPAIKVGRQWRFPSDQITEMLGGVVDPPSDVSTAASGSLERNLTTLLPSEAAQAIADLAADIFDVMAVVTDIDGNALTEVANPCGYFAAVQSQPQAIDQCIEGWRRLAAEVDLEPRFVPTHLGFLCARSFIRVGRELVGMLIVGGIAPEEWPPDDATARRIAGELGVPVSVIADHVEETYYLDENHRRWVLGLLPRLSDLISRLAAARSELLSKLDTIALLAGETNPNQRSTT